MKLFEGCLLACDIDGTLIENGKIPQRNCEKIAEFLNEGGMFCLATGRTVGTVSTVVSGLSGVSPSVMGNGSMIYDFNSDKMLYSVSIGKNDHEITKYILESFPNIAFEIHCGKNIYGYNENESARIHQVYENYNPIKADFNYVDTLEWNKVIYILEKPEDIIPVKEYLEKTEHNSVFVDTSVTIDKRKYCYMEHMPIGISKASAIKKICSMFNIKPGGSFAVGDYYNDVEMLMGADISAVPCESPDDVKRKATVVLGSAKDGVVADFIDYLTKLRKDAKNG